MELIAIDNGVPSKPTLSLGTAGLPPPADKGEDGGAFPRRWIFAVPPDPRLAKFDEFKVVYHCDPRHQDHSAPRDGETVRAGAVNTSQIGPSATGAWAEGSRHEWSNFEHTNMRKHAMIQKTIGGGFDKGGTGEAGTGGVVMNAIGSLVPLSSERQQPRHGARPIAFRQESRKVADLAYALWLRWNFRGGSPEEALFTAMRAVKENTPAGLFLVPRQGESTRSGMAAMAAVKSLAKGVTMKTILILEDEPAVMRLMRLMLKQYAVIEASTVEQAYRLFTEHSCGIDLLVADLTLPTGSGIRAALLLRAESPGLPVILTSGYPVFDWSGRDCADLERLGPTSAIVLQKPIRVQTLLQTVRELIGEPRHAAATGA